MTQTLDIPARTLEQRLTALAEANRIRTHRANLKRDIRAGRRSFLTALASPEPELKSMKVMELMLAIPKVGGVKVNKVLYRAAVSPSKTLGGLSDRQRLEIARLLGSAMNGTPRPGAKHRPDSTEMEGK